MKPGIYPTLDIEEYHGHRESISRSALMMFNECPRMYWAHYINPNRPPKNVTDAMIFGNAYHTLILEPHEFEKRYVIEPERVYLKDVGRELYDVYKAECEALEHSDKIVLSQVDWYNLQEMRAVLMADEDARELLAGAVVEQSYFWVDEGSGLLVKSRPDALHANMIVDLKTIDSAAPGEYQRPMMNGWYHVQGSMVRDARRALEGRNVNNVINIAQEKKYPYLVGIKIIDEKALDAGELLYKQKLKELKSCIDDNIWNGYEIETVSLPRWAE